MKVKILSVLALSFLYGIVAVQGIQAKDNNLELQLKKAQDRIIQLKNELQRTASYNILKRSQLKNEMQKLENDIITIRQEKILQQVYKHLGEQPQ